AARTPHAVAVVFEDGHLTYEELERRSNQLGHHLQGLGGGPEVVVGLCVERSLDLLIGLLGILKAGGAYLPPDPHYPHERLAYMLADARVRLVVIQANLSERLPKHEAQTVCLDAGYRSFETQPQHAVESGSCPDHLAYVIYTSGSTGRPKGVMSYHRG